MPLIPLILSGAVEDGIVADTSTGVMLRVGRLDLTQFARLYGAEPDPYGRSGFVEPQFSDSAYASGQPLVGVTTNNRQMSWPLYLNQSSKDTLHAFVREINQELSTFRPLRVQWRDEGATRSTFYDVAYARFDPEWSFPQARSGWLAGTLHVWCQPPYGHTGTYRSVASAAQATAPWVTQSLADLLDGDAPAEAIYTLSTPATVPFAPSMGLFAFVSVIKDANYPAITTPASIPALAGATLLGASGAIGSQVYRRIVPAGPTSDATEQTILNPPALTTVQVAAASGRNRVLWVGRTSASTPVCMRAFSPNDGGALGPTAVLKGANASGAHYQVADLGVIEITPSTMLASYGLCSLLAGASTNATFTLDTNALLLLPEERTCVTVDTGYRLVSTETDAAVAPRQDYYTAERTTLVNEISRYDAGTATIAYSASIDDGRRGAIPQPAPDDAYVLAGMIGPGPWTQERAFTLDVKVRESFTYAR